jgi:hypothetical protein
MELYIEMVIISGYFAPKKINAKDEKVYVIHHQIS